MRSGFSARIGAASASALALVLLALSPGQGRAEAQRVRVQADLGDLLFSRPTPEDRATVPRLARFRADTGDTFVLEVMPKGPAFLKYDDSGEVWALSPTPGPRGDVIYKNDVGEPMLRTTRFGGLTVFTTGRPTGMAAAFDGAAADLHNLLVSGPMAMFKVLFQASVHASRAAGHTVTFEANELDPGSEPVFADAASLAVQAFVRVDRQGKAGHAALARYDKVAFLNGRPPGVRVVGQEVRITVTPDLGFAGRPSSQRISQVLFRR